MLRSCKADSIPIVPVRPVSISIHAVPTFVGPPSGFPVTLMIPVIPCNAASYPGSGALGPVWPNPVTEAYIRRGFIFDKE